MNQWTDQDRQWMARALALAAKGRFTTHPNPRVGCVLVRDGVLVGEGFHQQAGGPHAEVHALRQAGEKARGATAYVSLEPCAHFGRTPPCALALVEAGVSRVVSATQDPNPLVGGKGHRILEDAGIEVSWGLLQPQALELNAGFIKRMQTGLPLVRVKMAMSLDGRTAMASGESQWITGSAARQDVQRLRAASAAIISAATSVIQDNAALTVRPEPDQFDERECAYFAEHQPLRVVLDREAKVTATTAPRLFDSHGKVLLVRAQAQASVVSDENTEELVLDTHTDNGLRELLIELGKRGCNEVLVETGATLAGAFAQAGLVDEYVIYMAPVLMGSSARPLFDWPIAVMKDKQRLDIQEIVKIGDDWRITAHPADTSVSEAN